MMQLIRIGSFLELQNPFAAADNSRVNLDSNTAVLSKKGLCSLLLPLLFEDLESDPADSGGGGGDTQVASMK